MLLWVSSVPPLKNKDFQIRLLSGGRLARLFLLCLSHTVLIMTVTRTFDILDHNLKHYNKPDALVSKSNGKWHPVSIKTFCEIAEQLSYGLMHRGIGPGDKVAIISGNCPEWNYVDFAVAAIGAVSVPVYPTMGKIYSLYFR